MRVDEIRVLLPDAPPALIPLASVEAACGFPSPAQDYQTSEIDLNEHLMPNRVATSAAGPSSLCTPQLPLPWFPFG